MEELKEGRIEGNKEGKKEERKEGRKGGKEGRKGGKEGKKDKIWENGKYYWKKVAGHRLYLLLFLLLFYAFDYFL